MQGVKTPCFQVNGYSNNKNVIVTRCNIHDCYSSAFLIFDNGHGYNNEASRITNCRIYNNGLRNPSTIPAFLRHYNNQNNKGTFAGNNMQKSAANQPINWIDSASPQNTNNYPVNYNVNNNFVYEPGQNYPNIAANPGISYGWNAQSGFSNVNGANNWCYQWGDGTEFTDMHFDASSNRWAKAGTLEIYGSILCLVLTQQEYGLHQNQV